LPSNAGAINVGPHAFTEVLYAFTSCSNNNGSAYAGLDGNTPFYNLALGICMFIGRFIPGICTLAMAGSLAAKKTIPTSSGSLPTYTPLFVSWLIAVILIVGALAFLPALGLGPIVEQLKLMG
jgi:K+-transporting ATPase ATPase A chain